MYAVTHCKVRYTVFLQFGLFFIIVSLSSFTYRQLSFYIRLTGEPPSMQLHQQSALLLSTGTPASCRRTSALSDSSDWKECYPIMAGSSNQRTDNQTMRTVNWRSSTLEDYIQCASDCNRFLSEFGYWTSVDELSKEELEFPLAFRYT